ncbi:MAG: hypothetical protein M1817_001320 [Caeruleum heppii]|nr:MAG: hypothetical protein M1817_001320 [Caeruleum heppii]
MSSPPPSYTSTVRPPAAFSGPSESSSVYTTSTAADFKKGPYPAAEVAQTYNINYVKHSWTCVQLFPGSADPYVAPAYFVRFRRPAIFSSKPEVRLYRGETENEANAIATAKFPKWTGGINITYVPDRVVTMDRDSVWKRQQRVLIDNREYQWKGTHGDSRISSVAIKLMDESNNHIATINAKQGWSMDKYGRLDIHQPGLSLTTLDQIVATGMAMVHFEAMQRAAAATAC